VLDGDSSTVMPLGSPFTPGTFFSHAFSPSQVSIHAGYHQFSFYLINEYGDVSLGRDVDIEILGPTDFFTPPLQYLVRRSVIVRVGWLGLFVLFPESCI
jgi:hypothetical protein